MTEPEVPSVSRRTVVGAAWAAPVIVALAAAPQAAASAAQLLDAFAIGPDISGQPAGTAYRLHVGNSGLSAIPAGGLTLYVDGSDRQWTLEMFDSDGWAYGPGTGGGPTYSYVYTAPLAPGETITIDIVLRRAPSTVLPTAQFIYSAPGYDSKILSLQVPF
ncbi:hypothetical protein [Herbiconiux sp. A18JL235]|uniref:Secreted protein n=1 Tax=Herbiconiux sp. A18JL235 TaxID=3152363 RepID=A0AB39BIL6_9MICO